jgi:sporulation protein YlmC with PRC-barrel domain
MEWTEMPTRRVRLHRLLNRDVVDSAGRRVGRVEEVRATVRDGECFVEEYVLGREGLVERLSVPEFSFAVLSFLGAGRPAGGRRVPWHQMDLSDPRRPRLRCTLAELKTMQPPRPQG